ncbi:MAG: hypothetical protein K0R39_4541 [Symbiobacteriaceae bacterium]|jgi:hypothetical protein|nr:hypothetical protein [Symbiobacteriaceae bacterium]
MPLPSAEPIGLPAPAWLLQALLVLTFSLHLIPMTLTVGGTLMALYSEVAARLSADGSGYRQLAQRLWRLLPTITAFTITLGVAPLLFIQLVYGKFFYPASVLTAWSWLGVVPLLLVGYGMLYAQSMGNQAARWRPWAGLAAALSFLGVLAIYVSTMSLTTQPGVWRDMYAASQGGTHWHFELPRALHVLCGAVAMAGGLAAVIGHGAPEAKFGRLARRFGLAWAAAGVILQIPAGLWFYNTLPSRDGLLLPLVIAAGGLGLVGLLAFLLAGVKERRPSMAWMGLFGLTLGAVALAVQRHLVRQAALSPNITAADWKLSPQWDVFGIFAVLLVLTIGLIGYLFVRFLRAPAQAERKRTDAHQMRVG